MSSPLALPSLVDANSSGVSPAADSNSFLKAKSWALSSVSAVFQALSEVNQNKFKKYVADLACISVNNAQT